MAQGWGVYMMTYRGYGGGTGSPTETANVADARLAYGALVLEGVEPASIVLYGESLGSGIAVRLATERTVGGLVLDAPYTSIVDVAAQAYPFLPVRLLIADRYETTKYIAQVRAPLQSWLHVFAWPTLSPVLPEVKRIAAVRSASIDGTSSA